VNRFAPLAFLAAPLFGCSEPLPPADVGGLDDDFTGKEIDAAWLVLNGSTFERKQADGKLVLKPTRNTVWYKADQGPGLVKRVTGNFRVSTTARARKASDPSKAVDAGYQFAGIIARDPASDEGEAKESYVFNVVGYRGDYLSVETKTTKKDVSYVEGPEWNSGDAELRICRYNDELSVYKRPIGEKEWQLGIAYKRKDLPATLQVGPIAYAFTDKWDLEASFEEIRFAPVKSHEDCVTD
jgi:hypothetical protein